MIYAQCLKRDDNKQHQNNLHQEKDKHPLVAS